MAKKQRHRHHQLVLTAALLSASLASALRCRECSGPRHECLGGEGGARVNCSSEWSAGGGGGGGGGASACVEQTVVITEPGEKPRSGLILFICGDSRQVK